MCRQAIGRIWKVSSLPHIFLNKGGVKFELSMYFPSCVYIFKGLTLQKQTDGIIEQFPVKFADMLKSYGLQLD